MATHPGLIHLHCGDAAAAVHRKSGLPGELRIWRDSPAVGPWTPEAGHLTALRAHWWGAPLSEMRDLLQLQDLGRAREPVLWFGPDPWEQACLLWVLAELPEGCLPDLVPLEQGVGRMPPGALPRCFTERSLLEAETVREAAALWKRFLVEGWGSLGQARIPALPWLGPALARLAEDHPAQGQGRTRRQIQILADQGLRSLPVLMQALARQEDPRYGAWFGDLFVARVLEAMGVRP